MARNEGARAESPCLKMRATLWARATFSSGKHQISTTDASTTNRLTAALR